MIPFISIQSQRGLIGIESTRGQYEIRRPQPTLDVQRTPTVIHANNRPGNLQIDQSLTNDALTGGKPEAFWQRIYSQYKEVARSNIEQIVEKGNLVGDLRNKVDPRPLMALDDFIEGPPDLQVYGFASPANIQFSYTPNDLNLEVIPGGIEIKAQIHRPEINYHRGGVNIYMKQYPKVTITPPAIDLLL
ncbi:DUF6470 family protein [Paenibacillaceae bacterium WGS1546]|uniref:DUF6470 family protein n=1 Tax=Cohnella sp. WGS1546 TaxID=3366810 RepID=UPI00372D057E